MVNNGNAKVLFLQSWHKLLLHNNHAGFSSYHRDRHVSNYQTSVTEKAFNQFPDGQNKHTHLCYGGQSAAD